MKKEISIGIALTIVGVLLIVFAGQLHDPKLANDVGPRLFPRFCGWGLVICGIGVVYKARKSTSSKQYLSLDGWKRLWNISGVILIYTILLFLFGFIPTTPILIFVLMIMMGQSKKTYIKNATISVVITVLVYFLFEKVLYVMLPSGELFK